MQVKSVLDLVGNTPMIKLEKINPNPDVSIYAKLEKLNPMGSVKDRIALFMLEEAEREGKIDEDTVIVEGTSGNTGLGLAMVCAVKDYHLHLTMSKGVSVERMRMLTALGAEIEFTPEEEGTDGAIKRAEELAEEKENFWRPDQFDNPSNVHAHYETTGKEILEDTDGELTHFIGGMGTTGTLMGVSKRLKEHDPEIKIIGVEPTKDYDIQGLKNMEEDIVPDIYEPDRLDEIRKIEDEDAFCTARELAINEGLFVGMSSGAAVHISRQVSSEIDEGRIVTLLPDGGERYFSTPLFDMDECLKCMYDKGMDIYHPPENKGEYLKEMKEIIKEKEE
ncbi:MAG: cysteine synthase family protein [Candidatus Thermoplasmatota archaeon]|nr:cysteine synthase family protein [Candidatus Thermoplasmatota archaeon]